MNPLELTLGQLAAERPAAAAVLERYGLDYCCGGGQTLAEACRKKCIDAEDVLAKIAQEEEKDERRQTEAEVDWLRRSLAELCDHIERTHHDYLKAELPRLTKLIDKVVGVHGPRHPKLRDVQLRFSQLRGELEPHMMKEEQVLFPAIRRLEQASAPPRFPFGSIGKPIAMMRHEHDQAGAALKDLRELTDGFTPPDDACNSYRTMLDALQTLEEDLHLHIHKENNILFPRAEQLQAAAAAAQP